MRSLAVVPVLALLASAVACGPVATTPAKAVASAPAADPLAEMPAELREIARDVEQARGLAFRRPVRVVFVDEDELESHFDEGALELAPDAVDPAALWAFGLLKKRPPPSWLVTLLSRPTRRTKGLLGFYVGKTRVTYIRREHERDVETIAHELAHALVDDHLPHSYDAASDDRQLAIRALSEGDATITAALVKAKRNGKTAAATLEDASEWDQSRRDYAGADAALASSIPLYRERTETPYHAGATFVAHVVRARGMSGLDEVWRDPPRGTFEVFHPDVYGKGLALPRLGNPTLPEGCRVTSEGEMGELRTRAVLRSVHARAVALDGASGLVADRYRILEGCGPEPSFAWQTAWQSEESAERFEGLMNASFACTKPECLTGSHRVVRRGRAVAVTRNVTDERGADSLVAAIEPSSSEAKSRLGGIPLDAPPGEKRLVEGSTGRTCEIGASGVRVIVPPGLQLKSGHEIGCEMSSDLVDVSFSTKVINGTYGRAFADGIRQMLPGTLAASHEHVEIRERYRVTPLGTGLGYVAELTAPVHFEVVTVPVCNGKRVLTLYMRSTSEESRSMLEDVLASLQPTSVGLPAACGDPNE
jgi:hypothetical protein